MTYKAKRSPTSPLRERTNRRSASVSFQEQLNDGGLKPSELLLTEMRDEKRSKAERLEIAKTLLPFEIPKLQSIEAEHSGTISHEDALKALDGDADDEDAETLQ